MSRWLFPRWNDPLAFAAEPTDYSKPHRLRIRLGSLGPPSSHPVFRGLPEDITTAAVQEASLEWDGAPVFASSLDFGYRRGDGFNIGTNHLAEGASGPRFSGTIADVRQLPFERPAGRHWYQLGLRSLEDQAKVSHGGGARAL